MGRSSGCVRRGGSPPKGRGRGSWPGMPAPTRSYRVTLPRRMAELVFLRNESISEQRILERQAQPRPALLRVTMGAGQFATFRSGGSFVTVDRPLSAQGLASASGHLTLVDEPSASSVASVVGIPGL